MVSRKDKTMKRTVSLLLVLVLLLTLCGCGKKDGGSTWQEQYDLGVRYLSDGNYEEAIIAFTAAIEIDPKRAEAYLGLADAYIGTGDLDAARRALEDGLAATNDADIQARLDNLSAEAGNLTGQPPFSFQDLEDWGYPYGVDVYELRAQGAIYDYEGYETVDQWITRNLKNCQSDIQSGAYEKNRGGSLLRHNNPSISVRNTLDMNIMSVEIEEGDTCTGPRGLRLGMEAEEVLRLFCCESADAFTYLETGDKTLLDGYSLMLYSEAQDDTDERISGFINAQEDGSIDLQYSVYEERGSVDLFVDCEGGFVTSISVSYSYQ